MLFKKDDLQDMVSGDSPTLVLVETQILSHSRWSIQKRAIFSYNDRLYEAVYSQGATEYQDESPFAHDPDDIDCREVRRVEVITHAYEPV